MKKIGLKERLGYQLDLIMSRGTTSLILVLSLVTLVLVLAAGFAVILIERAWSNGSLPLAVWKSFTLTLDPGNLASVEGSLGLILVAALSTVGGIFITSTLISILNTGLSTRLENFQRGNARIIEKNHVLILGYSEAIFGIIKELQIANANQPKSCIVILGLEDKQVMEEQVARHIPPQKSTRIICRSGDPTSAVDLERCSLETCKSVIVNLSEDYQVIRTLLAAAAYLDHEAIQKEFPQSHNIHICASINERRNLDVARIAGQAYAEILHFNLIIARIMAHVCYQPGLSAVYTELFNFSGNEIYIEPFPELTGRTFHDAKLVFPASVLIGIQREGESLINPDPQDLLQAGDHLILIAPDDNSSVPAKQLPSLDLTGHSLSTERFRMSDPEDLLILGNSTLLLDILTELDDFLPQGSQITLAGQSKSGPDYRELMETDFKHLNLECLPMDITDRLKLDALLSRGMEHILLLSDRSLPQEEADAKTLTVLLQIRDWERIHNGHFSITSEMLDPRNQELAQVANVNDFVISSNITGLIMSQVSENRRLAPIFCELLDSAGSEIYLKPAKNYVEPHRPVDMYTLTHLTSLRKEVFLGFKRDIKTPEQPDGVEIILNPRKETAIAFQEDDWLMVLAED